jgi:hypothetical protein
VPVSGVNQGQFVTATARDPFFNTSEFALNVQVGNSTGPTPTPPPVTWASTDIVTAFPGETTINGTAVTVRGSGKDIWGKSDSFRYVAKSGSGDLELTAYISAWDGNKVNAWSKGGLMLRGGVNHDKANVYVMVTGNNGIRMQWRAGDGQATQLSSGANVNAPVWLKLIKVGNDVAA